MEMPSNLTIRTKRGSYTIMVKEKLKYIYFEVYDNDNKRYLKEHHLKVEKEKLENQYNYLTRAYKIYLDEVLESLLGTRQAVWEKYK